MNLFYLLIRLGLGQGPLEGLSMVEDDAFKALDISEWKRLGELAAKQALMGVFVDGVQALSEDCRPPLPLYLSWVAAVAQVEKENERLNLRAKELVEGYHAHHIPVVLLKGQGIAQFYPNPLRRQCGDIDVYLGPEHYQEANALLAADGGEKGAEESIKHMTFEWRGVHIENHRVMTGFAQRKHRMAFLKLLKAWFPHQIPMRTVGTAKLPVPPVSFDAIYILKHAMEHLLCSGVGFRQLMDWLLLVSAHREELPVEPFMKQLKEVGLDKAAPAVWYIGVTYLGFVPGAWPFPMDEALGEVLLEEILLSGNMGHFDRRMGQRPKGYWPGKWWGYRMSLARVRRIRAIMPGEADGQWRYRIKNLFVILKNKV